MDYSSVMEESNNTEGTTMYVNSTHFEVTTTSMSPVVPALMFSAGTIGNASALIILLKSKQESRRTQFYRLVGLLAFVDLLGIITTSPVTFLQYAHFPNWYGGQPVCHYFSFMLIFFGLATMFIVAVMALDRYVALLHPYFYAGFVSKHKAKYILGTLFTFSIIMSVLPLAGINKNVMHYPGTWCFFDFRSDDSAGKAYAIIYSLTGIIIIILITVSNVAVIATLVHMRDTAKDIYYNKDELCRIDREMQMMIFLIGVVIIFIICWAPLMVIVLLCATNTVTHSPELDILVIRLASFNQILDPWVYIILQRRHMNFCVRCVTKVIRSTQGKMAVQPNEEDDQMEEKQLAVIGMSDVSASFEKALSSSYRSENDQCTRL